MFAVPGDIETPSGGYGYDRRVLAALPGATHLALPGAFPHPSAADAAAAVAAIEDARRDGDVVLIDGLAYGALPAAAIGRIGAPIVALCHHPLCLETGLDAKVAAALRDSETQALALAARVIVTSAHTAALLAADFGAPPHKIIVAPPGTDEAPRARGSGSAPALLAVGSIIPRKAFDLLVDALADLADLDWRLTIAGSLRADTATAAALRRRIDAAGLAGRVVLTGALPEAEIAALYAKSNVFVSSSLYEGYGMALADALARGLPIITTTGGAAAETIPDAAALKVPPGDRRALRAALRLVLVDHELRAQLADASWTAAGALPRWEDTARMIEEAARAAA
nr:glycosyltransferase family 4 protein [Methylosinus sp. Sm6]